ncbi:2-deoxyribose-5-phosphate aldolase [Legionella beliardensis]|uniref:deoxyribose-phosphate aldolase n=1 Tax=Legionella beliardensis TaxID=91822 RepID=A0A378I2L0_9GAMM|nr:deoxyribose-phosphate aldolase [Legionella beliardensis]STX28935.1 2-deoxyribose-5-phosphate aldolase [Legionella beliardensis]
MSLNLDKTWLATLKKIDKESIEFTTDLVKSVIDLTLLDELADNDALKTLAEEANSHRVAAVCVFPEHLEKFKHLETSKRATVVNFPKGQDSLDTTLATIQKIALAHVDEVDYVFAYPDYLSGHQRYALQQCHEVYACCQANNIRLKVILETGAFPNAPLIYKASCDILNSGCDFLKTSTGKIKIGATPLAAFSMLKAITDSNSSVGIKISGGIKQLKQAYFYMALAAFICKKEIDNSWFRIGSSSLHRMI